MDQSIKLYLFSYQPTFLWIINDNLLGYNNLTTYTDSIYGGSFQSLNLLTRFYRETKELNIWTKNMKDCLEELNENKLVGLYPDVISGFDDSDENWFQVFCDMNVDQEKNKVTFSNFSVLNSVNNSNENIYDHEIELTIEETSFLLMNYAIRDHTGKLFQLYKSNNLPDESFFTSYDQDISDDIELLDVFDYHEFSSKIINDDNTDHLLYWDKLQLNYLQSIEDSLEENTLDIDKFLCLGGTYPLIFFRHMDSVKKFTSSILDDLYTPDNFSSLFDLIRLHFIELLYFHEYIVLKKLQFKNYLVIREKFRTLFPEEFTKYFSTSKPSFPDLPDSEHTKLISADNEFF